MTQSAKKLHDKIAFVTGAASGIGLALADELGKRGASVMMSDNNAEMLQSAAASLRAKGLCVDTVLCDVANAYSVQNAADKTLEVFGKIHILINNAGVSCSGPTGEIPFKDWNWAVGINLMGVVHGAEIFVPLIKSHGEGGHIINTASMAGHVALPRGGPYNATKFAVVGLSETMRGDLATDNIGVSVLCPGWVKTSINSTQNLRPSRVEQNEPTADPSEQMTQVDAAIEAGLPPSLVAEWALDCMDENRFYIFTHPEMEPFLDGRNALIKADFQAVKDDPRFSKDAITARQSDTLEVLVIGAGFSGVCAGIKLLENGVENFKIYDKSKGIGGTWWLNTYPGAACDIPSHFYCFSFEMNPDWSRLYAPQPEIQAYIEHCAEKYDLTRRIHLNREIVSVIYNDQTGLWTTTFQDGEAVKSRFVINGSGGLHEPSIPAFNGLDQFQGTTMHTTRWDDDFDWAGKRVAVIGSAASAIQAIPQLAKTAAHVGIYQRTPNYIAPRDDYAYSADQQAAYAADPSSMIKDRETMFRDRDTQLYPIVVNKGVRDIAAQQIKGFIQSQVTDPVTQNALMPDYELGCKRILISDDYLPALNRDNVALITAPIDEITNTGIKTGDGETPYDAIVFATGFNLNAHQFALDLRGEKGRKLSVQWQDAATAYRSVMIPNFPNYFMSTGPNSGVGTTSVVFMIEQTVDWIMQAIKGAGAGSVSVTDAAAKTYNSAIQKDLSKTVWASGCQSWYLSDDGRIETLYPGNAVDFQNMMKHLDGNDLEFFSVSNGEKTMLVPELSTPKIAAKPELEICGTYDPAFAAVRDNFESNFHDHNEIGASVCLSIDGKTVVDLWAGHRDAAQTKPWEQNTIGVVFSCTKAATALCAHLLVDRGQLDLDAKVTTYWPEFTGGGKEHATVRMLLNHSVGLPAFRGPLKDGAYADWDYMVSLLESEEPFWEPGTKNGYHMVSFGWTVGEVIRRVSGKSLGTFFRDEIAGPLGLDFHIGTPASEHARMADVIPYVPDPTAPITPFVVALMTNTKSISHLALLNNGKFNANQSRYIEAEIGGAGGVANARSLVGMFTPLATKNGFLSDARIDTMRAVSMQSDLDETLLIPTRFGEGFMLSMDNTDLPVGNSMVIGEGAFGHVGMGGSVGFAHPESGLAFGYTMNNMGGGILLNERGQSLVNTACSLL